MAQPMTSRIQLGAIAALILTLLSGCALLGPDHQTPAPGLSAAFINAGQSGLSTEPVHTRWWQGFKDADLNRLIDLAVAGNHDLRIASARLREARALWDETEALGGGWEIVDKVVQTEPSSSTE